MNKLSKLLSVFVIAGTVSAGIAGLAGCHTHTYSDKWSSDETQHWHAATCGHDDVKGDVAEHVDENDDGKCDVCGYVIEEPQEHEHTYAPGWTSDHWHAATCEHTSEKGSFAAHTDADKDGKCDVCGYVIEEQQEHEHTYAAGWTSDETGHWHAATCEHTDEKGSFAAHTDADKDGKCDVCGYVIEEPQEHEHTYAPGWTSDETGHWHAATCEHTSEKGSFAAHTDADKDGKCDVCGYVIEEPHEHTYSDKFTAKDETGHWRLPTCDDTTTPTRTASATSAATRWRCRTSIPIRISGRMTRRDTGTQPPANTLPKRAALPPTSMKTTTEYATSADMKRA